jgi:hypothetical protein
MKIYASHLYKDPLRVPIHQAPNHPICVKCRFYLPPTLYGNNIKDLKKGYCEQSGTIHVIDGSVLYEQVEYFRQYVCKGEMFECKDEPNMSMDDDEEPIYTDSKRVCDNF